MLRIQRQKLLYNLLLLLQICRTSNSSDIINNDCDLHNGELGTCKYFKDCPSALELKSNGNTIKHCGFEQLEPIVCCEIIQNTNLRGSSSSVDVGAISRQKCNEIYFGLKPINQEVVTIRDVRGKDGIGGFNAAPQKYVHMAVLGYGTWPDVTWGCGGSLISEKFILTAAHCTISINIGPLKYVRLGDLDLKQTTDEAETQDFNISQIIRHSEYHPRSVYNDIALIKLDGTAKFTPFVKPACLNTELMVSHPDKWVATGWGVTSYYGSQADHLQEMVLRNSSFSNCQKLYQNNRFRLRNGINDTIQLCAGHSKADTCQGDSGGPLQILNPHHEVGFTVIGVTSFGKPCGWTSAPGVYVRVSYYIGWIESIVWPQGV